MKFGEVTPENEGDVAAALDGPRRLWIAACDAGKNFTEGRLPEADSAAMAELADEATYVNEHWKEPVRAAHSVIRVGLFAVNDHLRNYARLFDGQPVPVYSHLVVARSAIETAAHAFWLAAPVGTKQRVQRYLLHRLANANAMSLGHAPGAARDNGKRVRENVRLGTEASGWRYRSGKRSQTAQIGDEEQPTSRQLIDAVLAPPSITSAMGDLLWWYLSGVTHGEMHALSQSIQVLDPPEGGVIGEPMAAFYTNAGSVAIMGQAVLEACVRLTERVAGLFGWSSDEWSEVVGQTADMGRQIAEAVAEHSTGA